MEVTVETSQRTYREMLSKSPEAPLVPIKPARTNKYVSNGKSVVALVRSDNCSTAIREAISLLGGLDPILKGLNGTILLKPCCNSDDPFPASTHPETVKLIAELLLHQKIQPNSIILGDMSGRLRGLPTKWTMENMGLTKVASDLGLQLSFFEDEDRLTVKHPKMHYWPDGIRIPLNLYTAARVIILPTLKTHHLATFSSSLKTAVGLTDALGREWLHNGNALDEKIAELNLAYTPDLIIVDGTKCFISGGPEQGKLAQLGITIAGADRVAIDAVGVSLLKQLGAEKIAGYPIKEHMQLKWAKKIELGNLEGDKIELRTSNPEKDPMFSEVVRVVERDLFS